MTLPELCIRRPVFTTMLIALPVTLVRNLLFLRQDGFGASEVHNHVLALEALNDP